MSAQEILKMIESVDPSDTAKLDEIDARVWLYLKHKISDFGGVIYPRLGAPFFKYQWQPTYNAEARSGPAQKEQRSFGNIPEYTRSRDALKAIRPEGWICQGFFYNPATNVCGYNFSPPTRHCVFTGDNGYGNEELAELRAILQAIEYERLTPAL